jgi:hypothetical protein
MANESDGTQGGQGGRGNMADELRDAGAKIGGAALDRVEAVAEDTKAEGFAQVRQVAAAAEHAADDLQEQSPILADYVRDAAHKIESMGEALRERTVGEMLSAATDYGRKQPILMFAGAAVLGFALSRFVRAGLSPASNDASEREAVNDATGIGV